MGAVYQVSGQQVQTSATAAGPWDPTMQHGAAPAALVAWAAERVDTETPMRIARLTLDLLRPVPVAPLQIHTEVVRKGRKIQLVAISLMVGGAEVVRASALRVRLSDPSLPEGLCDVKLAFPGPEISYELSVDQRIKSRFLEGVSQRLASGTEKRLGPKAMWFRANQPMVEGAGNSPVMRAAIAADFCNGVSSKLDAKEWTFINADITLNLARTPVGEWILVDAETWLGPDGCGIALARLGDTTGYFGRAAQSVIIERR